MTKLKTKPFKPAYCIRFFTSLIIWILLLCICLSLTPIIKTKHYVATDIPDNRFMVLVLNNNNQTTALNWKESLQHPQNWVREASQYNEQFEDYLIEQEDNSLLYHNEGALWYTESRYRINGDRIVPISFAFVSFMDFFVAVLLVSILHYVLKRCTLFLSSPAINNSSNG